MNGSTIGVSVRRYAILATCLVAAIASACSDDGASGPPSPTVSSLRLVAPSNELQLGDSAQLVVTVLGTSGEVLPGQAVTWTSSSGSILQVSASGMVIGTAPGSAQVTASAGGRSATITLQVHSWNVAAHALVVDSMILRLVSDEADHASSRLRFAVQGQAPAITEGSVVVGVQGGGFLRRVKAVTSSASEIILETEQASLAEIVEEGGFATSIDLLFAPGVSSTNIGAAVAVMQPGDVTWGEGHFSYIMPGARYADVQLTSSGALSTAGFELGGVDICQLVALASTGGSACPDQLKALKFETGSLDFAPDLDVEASFSGFALEEFRGVLKGSVTLDLQLLLEVAGDLGTFEANPTFFTFTRPFYAQIGPVPVLGYAELEVKGELSLKASAKGTMRAGFRVNGSVEVGAEYEESWSPIIEGSGSFEPQLPSVEEGTLKGTIELEAKVAIKPRAQLIFYGVIGPFGEVEPFGAATLSFGTTCGFRTDMAVNSAIGFTVPFLDDEVADFSKEENPLMQGPQSEFPCPLGTIDVRTTTNGPGEDAGYTVLVDGEPKGGIGSTAQLTIPLVETGQREVALSDVPGNCTVQGDATRHVTVLVGGTHAVEYVIMCSDKTGSIEVTTSTNGGSPDPDGYTVRIGGAFSRTIGTAETIVIDNIAEGSHSIELTGLESNCAPSSANPGSVGIVADDTVAVHLAVTCSGTELIVRTSTSGPPASSAAWTVTLDNADARAISSTGQVTYSTTPGQHSVALDGPPDNCEVTGSNPVAVDVAASGVTEYTFQVLCQGASLNVTVSTDGDPDPATTYTVSAAGQTRSIDVNGSVSFSALPEGASAVEVRDVPEHCTVQGLNPRSVVLPGSTEFEVVCQPPLQCTDAPEAELWSDPVVGSPMVSERGTLEVVTAEFGFMEASASAISDGTGWQGPLGTASIQFRDAVKLIPFDSARVGGAAHLRIRHTGQADLGDTRITMADFGYGPTSGSCCDLEGGLDDNPTIVDEVELINITFGEWTSFSGYMAVRAEGLTNVSVSAWSRMDFIDVVDSVTGEVIPVSRVCTASGHTY